MSASQRAWVLNFDAELELEAGARYTPSRAMESRIEALARALRLPAGDTVIAPLGHDARSGAVGRAWCPTPRALAILRHRGLEIPSAPEASVLRRVNERGFALSIASEIDDLPATRLTSLEHAEAWIAGPSLSDQWLLKRGLAVAGRGQRPLAAGPISIEDRRWIAAALRSGGGLYVEPRLPIERELSVHGWVIADRAMVRSIREQVIHHRAFVSSALARGLPPAIERTLLESAEHVGRALASAGYWGPYGIDAFLWRDPSASLTRLRALSEINARYCMGWDDVDGWDPPE